jgi:hypothetical protein
MGYRSMTLDCRRFQWTAGPAFDTKELRLVGVASDRRADRGELSNGIFRCEHVALAGLGSDLKAAVGRREFPYRRGRMHDFNFVAFKVHDYPLFVAERLTPLRVEEGQVVEAVQDALTVLLDAQTGAVARISTKYGLFERPMIDVDEEASPLWQLANSRRPRVAC